MVEITVQHTQKDQPARQDIDHKLIQQWKSVCLILQRDMNTNHFSSWIAPIRPVAEHDSVLILHVPKRFMRDWVRTHYADKIRQAWLQVSGRLVHVDVRVSMDDAIVAPVPAANDSDNVKQDEEEAPLKALSSPLDPRLTFGNFVTGATNALACAAAQKMSQEEKAPFNPLYIYGSVGQGKTHLMQAAAQAATEAYPGAKVVYMSAERFMVQFVQALRRKDTMTFKQALRGADILLIDDLQFICGKEATQEEFFHTFNDLFEHGKKIMLVADRAPRDLDGLHPRLRSRLAGGLAVQIQPADETLRLDILRTKCALLGRHIAEDVLCLLASRISASVRELEGALHRLIAQADLLAAPVTLDMAEAVLGDVLSSGSRRVSIEEIQKHVASYYGIRIEDLLSARRARPVARPRQMAMYLSKKLTSHSLPEIGRRFGGRDHTTIIHGVRKIEALCQEDPGFAKDLDVLYKTLTTLT